jgi:hypothetical protein
MNQFKCMDIPPKPQLRKNVRPGNTLKITNLIFEIRDFECLVGLITRSDIFPQLVPILSGW